MSKVLIACEYSGIVRDAFRQHGHDAISCDLLPTEKPGPHVVGDALELLDDEWDLIIAHPPCTYLANSGVRWLHERPERWPLMEKGAEFFRTFLEAPAPRVAVENPIIHKYAAEKIGRRQDQIIQPWQFGEHCSKAICLWLRELPPLKPTEIVPEEKREQKIWKMAPGPDRRKERSRFFPGVAEAMALQWGELL